MKEAQTPHDIVLVHGYTDKNGWNGDFDVRNTAQFEAASVLDKSGRAEAFLLAGGPYWGKDKPTYAEVACAELEKRGINPSKIIIRPETTTTEEEIAVLLDETREQGFSKPVSISTKAHKPRIRLDYWKKGRYEVGHLDSEGLIYNVKVNGEYPYRGLVKKNRRSESKFLVRESYAIFFDLIGFARVGKRFSDSKWGQRLKAKIDG